MGEVYRARDTRLQREVAIKVLPREFSDNEQLRVRFEREARTISALSHPNICTLHDVGRSGGHDYLVMELLDGETLADRLSRGPLPLADVIRYGAQIADALDRAHRSGVVHRDLKPGNVMITRSGAKLLDFGLAKPGSPVLAPRSSDSATEHKPLTSEGVIVGTFQYMAPEQIEGADADPRSDIFALGAVLYEMATGRRAFNGSTRTSLIAAIVSSQPAPVRNLQPLTPATLDHVIERCLAKDPDERWQSAKDVAQELRWIATATPPVQRRSHAWIPWTIAALTTLSALALLVMRPRAVPGERVVSSIEAPKATVFQYDTSAPTLSPDGKKITFVATGSDGKQFLWVRELGSAASQLLASTEGAEMPFWSPDGRWIAFFADGKLKKVDAAGGASAQVANAIAGRGGTWGSKGDIVFTPSTGSPLFRVSADGGEPQAITKLNLTGFDVSHRFPSFLPDGEHFLFFIQGPSADAVNVYVGSLNGSTPKPLLAADSAAIFAPPGYVLFVRDRTLRARTFDPEKLELTGPAINVADDVLTNANLGFANVSASVNNSLTYVTGLATTSRIVWLDRTGKEVGAVPGPANNYFDLRLSPDGKRLAVAIDVGGHLNLFMYDVARRVLSRITFDNVNDWGPVWSPDGQSILYTSFAGGAGDLWVKRVTGTEPAHPLVQDARRKIASDWSPDGKTIFYHAINGDTSLDMMAFSTVTKTPRVLLQTPFAESQTHMSPNGKWIAYVSNESGVNEIYVKQFDGEGKWQVSNVGAVMPAWSRDGRELFFQTRDGKLMSAEVHDAAEFTIDEPKVLFAARLRAYAGNTRSQYDVSPDGKTFVVNQLTASTEGSAPVTLVQNWTHR